MGSIEILLHSLTLLFVEEIWKSIMTNGLCLFSLQILNVNVEL